MPSLPPTTRRSTASPAAANGGKLNCIHPFWLLLCWACLITSPATNAATNSTEALPGITNRCAEFTLQDQFRKPHAFKFPRDKPTVLTVADKNGSKDIVGWAHPLAEKYGDKLIVAGLADVSAVPGPLRSLVRSKFTKAVQYPVMLDWEGDASRSFNYTKGEANIYLLSKEGRILLHLEGKADARKLEDLVALIDHEISPSTHEEARPK